MPFTPTLDTSGGTQAGAGYPGGLVEGPHSNDVFTGVNESATATDFGIPVCRGAAVSKTPINVKPIANDADAALVVGISVRNAAQVAADPTTNIVKYSRYDHFPILRRGRIYAVAAENVIALDQVLIITGSSAAQANDTCFGSSHGAGGAAASGRVAFKGAKWLTTTAAGEIGVIELEDGNLGVTTT
jgi:hypothetical protein